MENKYWTKRTRITARNITVVDSSKMRSFRNSPSERAVILSRQCCCSGRAGCVELLLDVLMTLCICL